MIRDLLSRHRVQPDPDRDQHFLDDPETVARMVEEADIEAGDVVLEIGAGLGTITREIAKEAGRVIAYENDRDLFAAAENELADLDNVDLRHEDFMGADVPGFDRCVANIPFHLSSEIVRFLNDRVAMSVLLVQEEFADRLVAEPGEDAYSRITVETGFRYTPVRLQEVPPRAFEPEMEVSGALVKLFPRSESFAVAPDFFDEVVKALFVHSGKKVRNAFYDSRHMFDLDKERARELRDALPHAEDRVTDLDLRGFVAVATFLHDNL